MKKFFVRVFRKQFNSYAKWVVMRAFERSLINSYVMHEICGIIDRDLWPERHKDQTNLQPVPKYAT